MPSYEYRCRECGDTFQVRRPMSESSAPTSCPAGHGDTVKLLTAVAIGGRASGGTGAPAMGAPAMSAPSGGGCCGGGCCG